MLTVDQVWEKCKETAQDVIDDLKPDRPGRDDLIERLDEECDTLWGQLVQQGRIDEYGAADLVRTAQPCAIIIDAAGRYAWVEDDYGLWQGLTYGVLASIAYFSLRNLLYEAMKDAGVDTNNDDPFAPLFEDEEGDE